jgi:hypothetical protein
MSHRRLALVALFLALVLPDRAHAFSTFGPHLGFSSGPDQVVLGAHLQFGDVAPQVDFVPSVDLGFGDHATLISLNGDFHYRFEVSGMTWQPYAGAGVGIHFIQVDVNGPFNDRSDTRGGGHFIVGADVPTKSGSRFFTELKLGITSDSPDLKLLAGWSFKAR